MIQYAHSKEDKLAAFRLRYMIYVEELGRDFLAKDDKQKIISDHLDESSTIMISKDSAGDLTGSLRVHFCSWNSDLENKFGIVASSSTFKYAVVDNFVLLATMRKSRLALQYIINVFEYGVGKKVDLCLIEAAPDLVKMYEKMGFTAYRSIMKYGHERYQMAIKPFDIDFLKACNSIFYKIMIRRQKALEKTYLSDTKSLSLRKVS